MSYLKKFGFVKGLAEGLAIDEQTKEGRVLLAMIDLLEEMADALSELEDSHESLYEELQEVSQDVERLDDTVEEMEECIENLNSGLGQILSLLERDEEEDDESDTYYEVKCPKCGEEIVIGEDMLEEGSINCPKCKGLLEFDLSCDDPDCEHSHHTE